MSSTIERTSAFIAERFATEFAECGSLDEFYHFLQSLPNPDEASIRGVIGSMLWVMTGRQTIRLTESLAQLLASTSIRNMPSEWAKMPFPVFALKLDGDVAWTQDLDGKRIPLEGCIIHDHTNSKYGYGITMVGYSRSLVAGETTVTYTCIALDGNITNVQSLLGTPESKANGMFDESMQLESEHLVTLVLNALVYISNSDDKGYRTNRDIDTIKRKLASCSPKKAKKYQRALNNALSSPPSIIYGRDIVIDKQLSSALSDEEKSASSGRRITCRFIVRGHWTHQVHGPQRSLRKPLWIKPYWKGPQSGAQLIRSYIAKGDQK